MSHFVLPATLDPESLKGVTTALRHAHRVLVCAHSGPDGDTLGATLGLTLGLRSLGKDATAYCKDAPPYNLQFLPGASGIIHDFGDINAYDEIVIVDVSEHHRVSDALDTALKTNQIDPLIIDHHLTGAKPGPRVINDPEAGATGEVICYVLQELGVPLTLPIAEALYCAIVTDTGSFRYSNTTPRILAVASQLLSYGVSPWEMTSRIYEDQPIARLRLTAAVLATLEVADDGKWASISLTQEMFAATGANEDMTDGLINHARSLSGVEVAISFRVRDDGKIKLSFRSRGRVNVAAMAQSLGGGGHHNAAGGLIDGPLDHARSRVYAAVEAAIAAAPAVAPQHDA